MKSYAKWAVSRVLESGGDDGDARELLGKTDPLVRGRARRHLQNHVEAVLIAKPDMETGRPMLEAVAERMKASPSKAKAPFWWPTVVFTTTLAAVIGLVAFFVLTYEGEAKDESFKLPPRVADAYENGGRPLSLGKDGEELFGERLAEFVIAAGRHVNEATSITELDLDKAQRMVLDAKYKPLLGDEAFVALTKFIENARKLLDGGDAIWRDADELNAALQKAGLGYWVDDSTYRGRAGVAPVIYSHEVERVRIYDVGAGKTETVLWLKRLDRINRRRTSIGETHANAKVAVIRRNLVDEEVDDHLLPMLSEGASYRLWPVSPSMRRPAEKDRVEALSGEVMRADFVSVGVDLEVAKRLLGLFAEREKLADDAKVLDRRKWAIEELKKLRKRIHSDENRALYNMVRMAYIASVEIHEVQHRLDFASDLGDPPSDLHKYLPGWEPGMELSRFGKRLTTEYSAYLSSMASSQIPRTTLVRLSWFVFDEDGWSRTYSDTASAVIESLCRVAGIEHGEFIGHREFVRPHIALALIKLLELPKETLQAHAKTAWESSFGRPLTVPVLRDRATP